MASPTHAPCAGWGKACSSSAKMGKTRPCPAGQCPAYWARACCPLGRTKLSALPMSRVIMNRQLSHRGRRTAADIPAALTADAALVSAAAAAAAAELAAAAAAAAVSCLSQARLQLEETLQ